MRAPAFGAPVAELYGAALDMAAYADEIGTSRVVLMEHHGSEDGYLPTPFVLGGGVAARTKRCRVMLGAVVLPLHDPVKIAEQIAVLDIMSGGRLEVVFGAGYAPAEFAAFNVPRSHRGRLLDEGIDIILRALHGERFTANGRPVFVRPLPLQKPEKLLLVGGGVEASARRAARFGLGFVPMLPGLLELYDAECRRLGREPGEKSSPSLPMSIHLTEEPDRDWAKLKPHVAHVVEAYAAWAQEEGSNSPFSAFSALDDIDVLRQAEFFAVWTTQQLLERAQQLDPLASLNFMPLLGGLSPEIGWESLSLLSRVLPRLQRH
jgi:alkanesulfonate monooxygenase SsuD/methylene tetrahydromethanopterin reductase-like flavin-dependent oxidoreductase (luciferase family)